eukprot:5398438-Pyramimonas_sp.AAC.1
MLQPCRGTSCSAAPIRRRVGTREMGTRRTRAKPWDARGDGVRESAERFVNKHEAFEVAGGRQGG